MTTLAEIEAKVADAMRTRGASPEGQEAIKTAEQVIAAIGEALGAPHSVTGANANIKYSAAYSIQNMGLFGAVITGSGEHKYAFGVRLAGNHIDVAATLFLIPGRQKEKGQWRAATEFAGRGLPIGDFPINDEHVTKLAGIIIAELERLAVAQAGKVPEVK